MLGPLKDLFRSKGGSPVSGAPPEESPAARAATPKKRAGEELSTRQSRGLEEFFSAISDRTGLTILDLGGATQQNVSFITNLGHRLYSENFVQILGETFGGDLQEQANPSRVEYFLAQTLDYPPGQFDGVLIWDTLEYLSAPLLAAVVEQLNKVVRPKSPMLAFFQADDRLKLAPHYAFRIQDLNTLQVAQQGERMPAQLFNNRSLEKLFCRYESVKFFLTREQLREVIIRV